MSRFFSTFLLLSSVIIFSCKQNKNASEDHPAYHNPTIQPYTDSINSQPEVAYYYYLRSIALKNVDADSLAELDLKKAIDLDSLDARFPLAMGFLFLDRGEVSKGLPYFQNAAHLEPNNDKYKLALMDAYIKDGDAVRASSVLDNIALKYPDLKTLEIPKAKIALVLQDSAKALSIIENYLKESPEDINALSFKAELLSKKKNIGAIAIYEKIFSMDTTNVQPLEKAGDFFAEQKNHLKAKEFYKRAIITSADATNAFFKMAEIYVAEDSLDKALNNYSFAINTQPNFAQAYLGKAKIFEQRKQKDSANYYYKMAYKFDPKLNQK